MKTYMKNKNDLIWRSNLLITGIATIILAGNCCV